MSVQGKIADNKIMIFSKSYCPHCMASKSLFADLKKSDEYSDLAYEVLE